MIRSLVLEPAPTSIARPSLEEAVRAIEGVAPRVSRSEDRRFSFEEPDGTTVEVRIEGGADGIERIGVSNAAGIETATHTRRFCVEVADSLDWIVREPTSGRVLDPGELLDPARLGRSRPPMALRRRLMIVAAVVVFPSAVLWHLGGRQRGPWFWMIVGGIGVYLLLRVWGLVASRRS